jgi:hypothetical protein
MNLEKELGKSYLVQQRLEKDYKKVWNGLLNKSTVAKLKNKKFKSKVKPSQSRLE